MCGWYEQSEFIVKDIFLLVASEFSKGKRDICAREWICVAINGKIPVEG